MKKQSGKFPVLKGAFYRLAGPVHDSLVAHIPAAAQGRVQGNQRAGVLVIVLGKLNLRGVEVLLGVQDFNVVGKACAVALKGEFYRRVVGFHGLGLAVGDAPQLVPLDERAMSCPICARWDADPVRKVISRVNVPEEIREGLPAPEISRIP